MAEGSLWCLDSALDSDDGVSAHPCHRLGGNQVIN